MNAKLNWLTCEKSHAFVDGKKYELPLFLDLRRPAFVSTNAGGVISSS